MKKLLLCAVLLSATLSCGAADALAIGFRGSTWGELRYDIPKEGTDNLLLNGWIKQGIDWGRWGNTSLNTYAKLRFKWDTEGYDWNNLMGPALGISFDAFTSTGFSGSLGAEYMWEQHMIDANRYMDQKVVIYANWYGWWDLKE